MLATPKEIDTFTESIEAPVQSPAHTASSKTVANFVDAISRLFMAFLREVNTIYEQHTVHLYMSKGRRSNMTDLQVKKGKKIEFPNPTFVLTKS